MATIKFYRKHLSDESSYSMSSNRDSDTGMIASPLLYVGESAKHRYENESGSCTKLVQSITVAELDTDNREISSDSAKSN